MKITDRDGDTVTVGTGQDDDFQGGGEYVYVQTPPIGVALTAKQAIEAARALLKAALEIG